MALTGSVSRKIAGEMVAIDDRRNGWRYLVLPIAQEDELVNDAVLSAAAFHFSVNVNAQFLDPGAVYQSAIRKLRLRQDMTCYNVVEQQKILLSLLVLLVAAVVSGSSDFRTIFGLLEGALYALGGEDRISHGELGRFVVWQIRKYRGWVSPHLSLEHGVKRLHQSVTKPYKSDGWEDISQGCLLYPKFESSWSLIYKLNEQACNIYVMRALAEPGTPPYTDLVDRFINTLELLPPDSPGMYLVPFTIFLAAAESSEVTQHELFENVLLEHSKRTGFANLPLALRFLREIWSGSRYLAWTEAFTKLPVFVV
ncbi:uncharacterized protein A1O9_12338 [Exophiala aquamarina CBS 119918]|uniref:Uncharacterized protein n=1 Tax=Exophiala aquamarina CBS 119918 TaxID=1182545 RepID=A0A072NXF0_9EURO|nr:uncharacterized protein A1O9_12338 [Exophiala aquamarina CBS 119918]KEF51703.1 hypothetical protein A1O9_12338 [Exophiala aquamarina CBS 119918]